MKIFNCKNTLTGYCDEIVNDSYRDKEFCEIFSNVEHLECYIEVSNVYYFY